MPRALASETIMTELFNFEKVGDQADYVMSVLRTRTAAMRNLEVQARKAAEELELKSENLLKTLTEYKIATTPLGQDIQKRMQTERFIYEAKTMFLKAQQQEQSQIGGIMLVNRKDACPTTTEVLGGFASWLGLLKKEGYFSMVCNKYDTGMFPGTGVMFGGNSGYPGQVWGGGLMGGYPQEHGWGARQVLPMQQHMVSCDLEVFVESR